MDNKTVIATLSQKLGRDPKDISILIEGFATIIKEQCGDMNSVAIPGFGTFEPIKEEERITTDLSTGKRVLLPPEITLSFSASAILRRKMAE